MCVSRCFVAGYDNGLGYALSDAVDLTLSIIHRKRLLASNLILFAALGLGITITLVPTVSSFIFTTLPFLTFQPWLLALLCAITFALAATIAYKIGEAITLACKSKPESLPDPITKIPLPPYTSSFSPEANDALSFTIKPPLQANREDNKAKDAILAHVIATGGVSNSAFIPCCRV